MDNKAQSTASLTIRPLEDADREWVQQLMCERWGAEEVVVHGTIYYPADLPGFVALQGERPAGLITYHIEGNACELVTIDSLVSDMGIGTALLDAVAQAAVSAGCARLWLITTNDNIDALRFYQKGGFRLVAVHRGAVDESRALKPSIPLMGEHGIPIRDEIELEKMLVQGGGTGS